MTPEQHQRVRDLFFDARKTARDAQRLGTSEAYAADDAAVYAFDAALRECRKQSPHTQYIEQSGVYTFDAGGKPIRAST